MNKLKLFLSLIAIIVVVGTAVAFKAKLGTTNYCTAPVPTGSTCALANPSCTGEADGQTTVGATVHFCTVVKNVGDVCTSKHCPTDLKIQGE